MSPSANCAGLVGELERSCAYSDAAITAGAWEALRGFLNDQRRLTHALSIAIVDYDGAAADALLRERLERILQVRDAQSRLVSAAHDEAGMRLRMIAQVKNLRRTIGSPPLVSTLGNIDSLR